VLTNARIALVTCAELVDLHPDDQLLVAPLAAAGVVAEPAVWDDPAVDWSGFDLVVLRSAWDYPSRRDAFVAWATSVERLLNPADVVAWNTDKRYLAALDRARVPVVPTTFLEPGTAPSLPAQGEWVLKPAIGAGSLDAGRYDLGDPQHRELARAHVDRLHADGRIVMRQPYLAAVDHDGETALLYLGGEFSHAVRKGPMLQGPADSVAGLYQEEEITTRAATPAQRAVADAALAAVPGGGDRFLYARVDLIDGPDGLPLLVELELTEPSLYLGYADGAPDRFAAAILAAVQRRS